MYGTWVALLTFTWPAAKRVHLHFDGAERRGAKRFGGDGQQRRTNVGEEQKGARTSHLGTQALKKTPALPFQRSRRGHGKLGLQRCQPGGQPVAHAGLSRRRPSRKPHGGLQDPFGNVSLSLWEPLISRVDSLQSVSRRALLPVPSKLPAAIVDLSPQHNGAPPNMLLPCGRVIVAWQIVISGNSLWQTSMRNITTPTCLGPLL